FAKPVYDQTTGKLKSIDTTGQNSPDGYYVPPTSTTGNSPKTSSVSILNAPNGDGSQLSFVSSVYMGHALDDLYNVGDTHPSATAIVHRNGLDVLYVTKSNADSLGAIRLNDNQKLEDIDLSLEQFRVNNDQHQVHGTYPNAIVSSPA